MRYLGPGAMLRSRRRLLWVCSMDPIMISVRGLGMRLESGGRPVNVLTEVSLEVPARQFVARLRPELHQVCALHGPRIEHFLFSSVKKP